MAVLTTPHDRALTLLFTELETSAAGQDEAFLGTPGSLTERTNGNDTTFWVHRYSDALNRRHEIYIGKSGQPAVEARVAVLRERIAAANATIASTRLLARAGFATLDRKAFYTLASLHNHGLFRAGALVIGSHAFGAILNALGVRAVPYATEDIDIARREALAISGVPSFLTMLKATGIQFFEVPALGRRTPSTSFAEPGGARLRVDLLVPAKGNSYTTIAVPELKAHAQGLPYLAYLLSGSQNVPMLSSHGSVMVRVPLPERYALHKLIVAQLRQKTSAKPDKDLRQAATLLEVLAERFPGAIEDAAAALPASAQRHVGRSITALRQHLDPGAEPVWEALRTVGASWSRKRSSR